MSNPFHRAQKSESKLRLALAGPAGSGKTYTALTLAAQLADGAPVAVIDTERGSASKYADLFDFDVLELSNFHPDRYVEAIRAAAEEGYAVVVLDSLSHGWNGADGMLAQVRRVAKLRHNGNTFNAWGDPEITRMESGLVEAITGANIHVIATMRSKTEYVVEQNDRGKAAPRKVGTAPVQRDGFEYEFDVFGEMTPDNELIIQKTRCPALAGAVIAKPGKPLAETLRGWLSGVRAPEPQPGENKPAEVQQPQTHHSRAACSQYAKDHGLSIGAYNRAATRYADNDELYAALVDGVRILEEKRVARERAEAAQEAHPQPEITFTPEEPGDPDMSELPVGARGN